jgi:LVIVD repeat
MRERFVRAVRQQRVGRRIGAIVGGTIMAMVLMAPAASGQPPTTNDPRVGLSPGLDNAAVAKEGMDLTAHLNKPPGWFNPANPGDFAFPNSDLAFQGDHAFVGNFNGFLIYNISNPAAPVLRTAVVCPGGQGDPSVYGNLLFMSVEENRAKKDCSLTPAATPETRFRGVRIFDISNIDAQVQVGQVQT